MGASIGVIPSGPMGHSIGIYGSIHRDLCELHMKASIAMISSCIWELPLGSMGASIGVIPSGPIEASIGVVPSSLMGGSIGTYGSFHRGDPKWSYWDLPQ